MWKQAESINPLPGNRQLALASRGLSAPSAQVQWDELNLTARRRKEITNTSLLRCPRWFALCFHCLALCLARSRCSIQFCHVNGENWEPLGVALWVTESQPGGKRHCSWLTWFPTPQAARSVGVGERMRASAPRPSQASPSEGAGGLAND